MTYISKSNIADFKMRIFNADGSEAKMCGNGIRCVGKFVYDKGYTDKKFISIETLSGVKYLTLQVVGGKVKTVAVDMGQAKAEKPINLTVDGETVSLIPVSVGTPMRSFLWMILKKHRLPSLDRKSSITKLFLTV